ncbi:uncharacterized protein C8A04DRAFT_14223 [Dichotomopilus funicola]|uniref:Uncharacterized protein n=1 Tax=Dichotomopilus funicola TaxID=1934379 RepID=A0AAN6UY04_9PEZI|nr:hypothetical protein C8A04DRAFT_14223 [Dichotomopilus funicola]
MSPTYTMSAHLCKQIYSSWRQARQTSPEPNPLPSPSAVLNNQYTTATSYFQRASSPNASEKRSMDSDRSETPATRQSSPAAGSNQNQNWRWGSR